MNIVSKFLTLKLKFSGGKMPIVLASINPKNIDNELALSIFDMLETGERGYWYDTEQLLQYKDLKMLGIFRQLQKIDSKRLSMLFFKKRIHSSMMNEYDNLKLIKNSEKYSYISKQDKEKYCEIGEFYSEILLDLMNIADEIGDEEEKAKFISKLKDTFDNIYLLYFSYDRENAYLRYSKFAYDNKCNIHYMISNFNCKSEYMSYNHIRIDDEYINKAILEYFKSDANKYTRLEPEITISNVINYISFYKYSSDTYNFVIECAYGIGIDVTHDDMFKICNCRSFIYNDNLFDAVKSYISFIKSLLITEFNHCSTGEIKSKYGNMKYVNLSLCDTFKTDNILVYDFILKSFGELISFCEKKGYEKCLSTIFCIGTNQDISSLGEENLLNIAMITGDDNSLKLCCDCINMDNIKCLISKNKKAFTMFNPDAGNMDLYNKIMNMCGAITGFIVESINDSNNNNGSKLLFYAAIANIFMRIGGDSLRCMKYDKYEGLEKIYSGINCNDDYDSIYEKVLNEFKK